MKIDNKEDYKKALKILESPNCSREDFCLYRDLVIEYESQLSIAEQVQLGRELHIQK